MKTNPLTEYVAAIDIGTSKICVLVGRVQPQGVVEVIGIGRQPSHGVKKGVIVNVSATVESLKKALHEACSQAGVTPQQAVVGISGGHIKSFNAVGVVGISRPDVTQYDIDRVVEMAKAVSLPQDREILHVLPQYFRVDGQEQVQDSLGMRGMRLEAHVHIVTGAITSAQSIIRVVELAGIPVVDIVLEQLASAQAVLTAAEQDLGVALLDIGAGTSDFAIYKDGRIRYSKVLPIGGNHFTNDLAIGLGLSVPAAEELKKKYGCVIPRVYAEPRVDSIDLLEMFGMLEPRAQELFSFVKEEIEHNRLASLMPAGFVLTGGGSLLAGFRELVQAQVTVPVRIGSPRYYFMPAEEERGVPAVLRSPEYATAYGLLAFALKDAKIFWKNTSEAPLLSRVLQRMKTWVYDFLD